MTRFKIACAASIACLVLLAAWPNVALAATTKTPILFVHGINSDKSTFSGWTTGLSSAGPDSGDFKLYKGKSKYFSDVPVFAVDYNGYDNTHGDIAISAQAVRWAITCIKQQIPTGKVFVVVHSMGGLLTRAYLEGLGGLEYNHDVAGFVTLDTPHMGSAFAHSGGFGTNDTVSSVMGGWFNSNSGQQLDPSSNFLKKLNSTAYIDRRVASTFVIGNHYPLLGDGLLTAGEQLPYMKSGHNMDHHFDDYRIECVDAVHSPQIGEGYYQALLWSEGKTEGEPDTSRRAICDTKEAVAIVTGAYNRATSRSPEAVVFDYFNNWDATLASNVKGDGKGAADCTMAGWSLMSAGYQSRVGDFGFTSDFGSYAIKTTLIATKSKHALRATIDVEAAYDTPATRGSKQKVVFSLVYEDGAWKIDSIDPPGPSVPSGGKADPAPGPAVDDPAPKARSPQEQLVGRWKYDAGPQVYIFRADGTVVTVADGTESDELPYYLEPHPYDLKDGTLTFHDGPFASSNKLTWRSRNRFELKNSASTRNYDRMTDQSAK